MTLTVTLAAVLAIPSAAAARDVTPSSSKVVSAHTAVSSCGTLSGISVSWTTVANVVSSVALGAIPASCNGGSLSLTLVGSNNASLGNAGPATISGTSLTLGSVSGSPTATSVTGAYLSVVGP